jgi:phospholipid transport system transporter-binding protein
MKLPERVTMAEAGALARGLEPLWAEARPVLDASALEAFDSAAISLLIEARRQAAERGRPLVITGVPPRLLDLAGLYGVRALIEGSAAETAPDAA